MQINAIKYLKLREKILLVKYFKKTRIHIKKILKKEKIQKNKIFK